MTESNSRLSGDSSSDLGGSTGVYLTENHRAFSNEPRILPPVGPPNRVVIESLTKLAICKIGDLTKGPVRYLRSVLFSLGELRKLNKINNSKKGARAIVIGNGPSQGMVTPKLLSNFSGLNNDIFVVNNWPKNRELSSVPPSHLVISDPATLGDLGGTLVHDKNVEESNGILRDYLLEHDEVIICCPIGRVKKLASFFGDHRVIGFVDTEMRWSTSNIDPRFPRGYLSMTLFKALSLAIFMGYDEIYIIGMDNTYPRDVFCDYRNHIFNYERHAGTGDYLIDVSSKTPSMDVWAQDIFQLFYDLRRCFSGSQVINLDPYSLTDVFPKVNKSDEIEKVLCSREGLFDEYR